MEVLFQALSISTKRDCLTFVLYWKQDSFNGESSFGDEGKQESRHQSGENLAPRCLSPSPLKIDLPKRKTSDLDSNGARLSPRKVEKKDMVVTRLQQASRVSHLETCRLVEEIVLNAFESCDTVYRKYADTLVVRFWDVVLVLQNKDGELQYDEFRQWIMQHPSVIRFFASRLCCVLFNRTSLYPGIDAVRKRVH